MKKKQKLRSVFDLSKGTSITSNKGRNASNIDIKSALLGFINTPRVLERKILIYVDCSDGCHCDVYIPEHNQWYYDWPDEGLSLGLQLIDI